METQGEYVFEVRDRQGRVVRLRRAVYERHLPQRPEMAAYVEEARLTIASPDWELVDEDTGSNCRVYYRLGLGRDKFEKCFLKVPVYYRKTLWGEEGEVATFHLTRQLGRGRVTWKSR